VEAAGKKEELTAKYARNAKRQNVSLPDISSIFASFAFFVVITYDEAG
jgi:hypothetical protein